MADGFYLRRDENMQAILRDPGLTMFQKIVGIGILILHVNNGHETAWMSMRTIAREVGCSPDTAQRAKAALITRGHLTDHGSNGRTRVLGLGRAFEARDLRRQSRRPAADASDHLRRHRRTNLRKNLKRNLNGADGGFHRIGVGPLDISDADEEDT